jgi:hypothetical protein
MEEGGVGDFRFAIHGWPTDMEIVENRLEECFGAAIDCLFLPGFGCCGFRVEKPCELRQV